ncbi:hypothetical protein H7827_19070 [Streptomyces sp. JH002]|nr:MULTISPECIES: hypothetical protein [unclassified Streptomyces]MCU4748630.1 hypothetical protein [Streptomyces sp. G-5]QQN79136.1 hypothetical protein IPZ77_18130 [Streptomyces sp. XC 2026]
MPEFSVRPPAPPHRFAAPIDRLLVGAGCLLVIGAPLLALASCTVWR